MRFFVAPTIALLLLSPATADDVADANRAFLAAMECAAYATLAISDPMDDQAARLEKYAFDVAPKALGPMLAGNDKETVNFKALRTLGGLNFWIGFFYGNATENADAVLSTDVPLNTYPNDPAAEVKAREDFAVVEFNKRNCDLLGR